MLPFDNGTILESSIGTILKSSIGTMLESSIGTMFESSIETMLGSSTESVLHFGIHPTPIQCRKPMSFRHWNVACRHRNDIVPILEPHLGMGYLISGRSGHSGRCHGFASKFQNKFYIKM